MVSANAKPQCVVLLVVTYLPPHLASTKGCDIAPHSVLPVLLTKVATAYSLALRPLRIVERVLSSMPSTSRDSGTHNDRLFDPHCVDRSLLRSQIVTESIDANQERIPSSSKKRKTKWTKVKYDGFQSTLDLRNSLKPLRPSKVRKSGYDAQRPTFHSNGSPVDYRKMSDSTGSDECISASLLRKATPARSSVSPQSECLPIDGDLSGKYQPASCCDEPEEFTNCLDYDFGSSWLNGCEPQDSWDDPLMNELDDILASSKEQPKQIYQPTDEDCRAYTLPKRRLSGPTPQQPGQPGLIESQRYDPRYPNLLLKPDSRPISQEQLASEVKGKLTEG